MFVGLLKRFGHLQRNRRRLFRIHPAAAQLDRQRFAIHQFHDDVIDAIFFASVIYGRDVRMIELGKCQRLTFEVTARLVVHQQPGAQDLDRHVALELLVAGPVHHAHSTRTQPLDKQIPPQPFFCPTKMYWQSLSGRTAIRVITA